MTTIKMIPLNQLVPSAANVRKTASTAGIEELAASIAAHGLLQNLQVRPAPKGKYEVVAGGRRLGALKLLVKQKRMDKDADIPCHILDGEDAGEISLAENAVREPMHPADQFAAFYDLTQRGKGVEEIAARFGVSVPVVRQRLKLAAVSPRLMQLYREDELSLDQLMAFTVTDDIAAQETAWFDSLGWQRDPANIRRALTTAHVEADDRRALFVGLETYKQAGGHIALDLFQPEHEGYLIDVPLLDRLVAEKLRQEADPIRAEGWRWVEIMPQFDYAERQMFKRVPASSDALSTEAQAELDHLQTAYDGLIEEHGDDPEQEIVEQLASLSDEMEAITAIAQVWSNEDKALSGAIITLERDGSLLVERGLVRVEDAKRVFAAREGGQALEPVPPSSGLSARLVSDLTAERTAALRAMMMDNGKVALAALAHALALRVFFGRETGKESCLDLSLVSRDLDTNGQVASSSEAAQRIQARSQDWQSRLPEDSADLFGWVLAQPESTVMDLLVFCAAQSLDAVRSKQDRANSPHLAHADRLAETLGLDMAQWWEPSADRYLGRVPKALVLEAVAEGVSPQVSQSLASLKKNVLVIRAQERLKGKGWLPTVLRPAFAPVEQDDPALMAAE